MARTTDDLLDALERFLPPEYAPLRPVSAGRAAQASAVEDLGDSMVAEVTIGGAANLWLTLLARGYGIDRTTDESDTSLRRRLRDPELQVTVAAIEEATNAILRAYGLADCVLIEHWDNGTYADVDAYADQVWLFDRHNAFTLLCPLTGNLADVGTEPIYMQIVAIVDRLRAAGVRWWLLVVSDDLRPLLP